MVGRRTGNDMTTVGDVVCVALSTDQTVVATGTGAMFRDRVTRHVVAEVVDGRLVRTICGVKIMAVSRTWQKDSPCKRCGAGTDDLRIEFTDRPAWVLSLNANMREYCFMALVVCDTKARARQIVRFMGYDPPEKILVEHPDLRDKIVYKSVANRNKFDPAPYDQPML